MIELLCSLYLMCGWNFCYEKLPEVSRTKAQGYEKYFLNIGHFYQVNIKPIIPAPLSANLHYIIQVDAYIYI